MGSHKNSTARGIRLPNDVWARLQAEAEGCNMTVHEMIRRRLSKPLSAARASIVEVDNDVVPELD